MDTSQKAPGLSLAVIGCGTLGTAILNGILSAYSSGGGPRPGATPNTTQPSTPAHLPTTFFACVKRPESASRLKKVFPQSPSPSLSLPTAALNPLNPPVTILTADNVKGVQLSDIIILGCKPQMVAEILHADGMQEAIAGKLVISILAGTTLAQLTALVPPSCRVIRVMPNTASKIRESMTVISCEPSLVPQEERDMVLWIFSQIGRAVFLSEKHMDASTALCGSGPAFYALVLEAMADGGVMMGLPRLEAQMMAAQSMKGAAGLVLAGQHPAIIREQVSTPAGCTMSGLLVLEDGRLRSTLARAIQDATRVASGLGK